jgi:hypothetical protein
MINLRLAVPAVLAAAAVAGCFTYLVSPPSGRVEVDQRLPPTGVWLRDPDTTASTSVDQHPSADEKAAASYREAAKTILRRAPTAQASADEPLITRPIPLPKRRPLPRW